MQPTSRTVHAHKGYFCEAQETCGIRGATKAFDKACLDEVEITFGRWRRHRTLRSMRNLPLRGRLQTIVTCPRDVMRQGGRGLMAVVMSRVLVVVVHEAAFQISR